MTGIHFLQIIAINIALIVLYFKNHLQTCSKLVENSNCNLKEDALSYALR